MAYKINDIAQDVLVAISDASVMRDNSVVNFNRGKKHTHLSAPWSIGTAMWSDGIEHLPNEWRDTCNKDLKLADVPTINAFKAIVEQIQGAMIQIAPTVMFDLRGVPEAEEKGLSNNEVNHAWSVMEEKSKINSEYDLLTRNGCVYGVSWIGLLGGGENDVNARSVHPEFIIVDPYAYRMQDAKWIAKIYKTQKDPQEKNMTSNGDIVWAESILPTDERDKSKLVIECWVLKGTKFANRVFKDNGIRFVIDTTGKIEEQEDWDFDFLPFEPFIPMPNETFIGASLASMLWDTQVRLDKALAVLLARASMSTQVKHISNRGGAVQATAAGAKITDKNSNNVSRPGARVVSIDGYKETVMPPGIGQDVLALVDVFMRHMEYIAGITRTTMGLPEAGGVRTGTAINAMAALGSRRVNRLSTYLSETIRAFAKKWLAFTYGITSAKVDVVLHSQSEHTREQQYQAVIELKRAGADIPDELLVDSLPGISPSYRTELLAMIAETRARREEKEAQMAQMGRSTGEVMPSQASPMEGETMTSTNSFDNVSQAILDADGLEESNAELLG